MSLHNHKPLKPSQEPFFMVPLVHVPIPPNELSHLADTMRPWLYSAILGNGRLLVCLDETGSPAQLFYPSLDAGPHIRSFLIGLQVRSNNGEGILKDTTEGEQEVSWLADPEWTHKLSYRDDAAVAHCVSTHPTLHIQVDQEMCVHHGCDSFINEIRVTNLGDAPLVCKLVIYVGFDIDYRQSGNTCYFDTEASMLTFFAADRYVSVTCDKPVDGFGCDQTSINGPDNLFQNANSSQFNDRAYAIGSVRGSVRYDLGQTASGSTTISQIHLCFGNSLANLKALSFQLAQQKPGVKETTMWWREQYTRVVPEISLTTTSNVYNRSLITLRLLTDSKTGGILAAPECDPNFRSCGGYGFCWPRDGALIAHTLDAVGYHDHARAFYDWALRVQEASGGWYHRYYMDGALAPTWGLVQFDEIGTVVWAICRHIQLTEDLSYGQKVFFQLGRACEYMQKSLDAETGLAPVTKDLWEERDGISTYACACTWAGFNELAHLSTRLGLVAEAERWAIAATHLKDAIEKHLWSASHQRFLRGMRIQISPHDIEQLRHQQTFSEANLLSTKHAGKMQYMLLHDSTVDTSILGLSIPFGVFSANDPRMIATAEAIARHLTSPVGGICRYQGDRYRGENPWIICTLWLALQYMNSERMEQGLDLYNWALDHRTSLDLFPEQIDATTGKPCWVVPLAWSHAMFLLATQECRKRGLLLSCDETPHG